jgi:hypothetical protein
MAVLPNRLERACPSEIVVIESPIQTNELPYLTKFNERWRRKPPAESIALDEAENQAFLGFKFGSAHQFRKECGFSATAARRRSNISAAHCFGAVLLSALVRYPDGGIQEGSGHVN